MIYEEYYKKFLKKERTYRKISELEDKKIYLMSLVDVHAASTKNSADFMNSKEDKMLKYASDLEQTEIKLESNRSILEEIKKKLKEKELDLRDSTEILDKVYLYKYIEHLKYYQIGAKIGYEKTKTYEFINLVKNNLKEIKKKEFKNCGKKRKNMSL